MIDNTLVNFAYGVQGSALTVAGNHFRLTGPVPDSAAIVADSDTATDNDIVGYDTQILGGIVHAGGNQSTQP
jgi:hypothetical protein